MKKYKKVMADVALHGKGYYVPPPQVRGHIVFGVDPIGISIGVCIGVGIGITLSCLHNIL